LSPSRIFILRPVATSLLMAALVLVGLVAYKQLPVSALPQVDYPTIQVQTFYPGAGPEVMTSSVTALGISLFACLPKPQLQETVPNNRPTQTTGQTPHQQTDVK